jgi:hypothetical protein
MLRVQCAYANCGCPMSCVKPLVLAAARNYCFLIYDMINEVIMNY